MNRPLVFAIFFGGRFVNRPYNTPINLIAKQSFTVRNQKTRMKINGNLCESYGAVVGADSISARKYITNPLFNKRKILQTFCYAKREFIFVGANIVRPRIQETKDCNFVINLYD